MGSLNHCFFAQTLAGVDTNLDSRQQHCRRVSTGKSAGDAGAEARNPQGADLLAQGTKADALAKAKNHNFGLGKGNCSARTVVCASKGIAWQYTRVISLVTADFLGFVLLAQRFALFAKR
jgi:hypothetical protein